MCTQLRYLENSLNNREIRFRSTLRLDLHLYPDQRRNCSIRYFRSILPCNSRETMRTRLDNKKRKKGELYEKTPSMTAILV